MKNEKETSNLNFNVQYFENRKTTYFDVFCLNFSIEAKIKTLFLISYFNLSKKKKNEMALWVYELEKIVVSQDCPKFFASPLTCVRQRVNMQK